MAMLEGATFYKEVGYSISELNPGLWEWKLHVKLPEGGRTELASSVKGQVHGTPAAAIVAAKRAIDRWLKMPEGKPRGFADS